jgi:hypothetical protein
MKLKPIAIVTPNEGCVYAPSILEESIEVDDSDFARNYADTATAMSVSLDPDGKSHPKMMTTYQEGYNWQKGRFIVE